MAKKRPGKYDGALDGLPAMPMEENPARQERLNQLKQTTTVLDERGAIVQEGYAGLTATELTAKYATRRLKRDALKAQEAIEQLHIDAITQLLVASQEDGVDEAWGQYGANENAIRLPDGSGIRVDREPASKVTDTEVFRLWCVANGYERKLQMHAGARESIVAERLLAGAPEPDGVETYRWSKIVFTAAK